MTHLQAFDDETKSFEKDKPGDKMTVTGFTESELKNFPSSLHNFHGLKDILDTAREDGRQEGLWEVRRETARAAKEAGIPIEMIAQATHFSIEAIHRL